MQDFVSHIIRKVTHLFTSVDSKTMEEFVNQTIEKAIHIFALVTTWEFVRYTCLLLTVVLLFEVIRQLRLVNARLRGVRDIYPRSVED